MKALVVHPGEARAALAASRALAQAGWAVGMGSPERDLVSGSRSVSRWHPVPSPRDGVDRFVEAVKAAVTGCRYEVVFGAGDAETLALSAHREELGAAIAHPAHEALVRALDKVELARLARTVGLETPRTFDAAELKRATPGGVVVKPRMNGLLAPQVARVSADPRQTACLLADLGATGVEPIVQERVVGELMAYIIVADTHGRIVARMQQRAPAIWPLEAGISARAETIAIDENLARQVADLVAALGWIGVAELQFLAPPEGPPVLIDFNGRVYGSLSLALAAGLNLSAMCGCIATGRPLPPTRQARVGARYQWLEGDLRRARAERRGGLVRDVATSLLYAAGATHSMWAASDPLPAARRLGRLLFASADFRSRAAGRRLTRRL